MIQISIDKYLEGKTDTSQAVYYEKVKPCKSELHKQILQAISSAPFSGLTPDEFASIYNHDILKIRPRFTELKILGKIEDTGIRRKNSKNNNQKVYKIKG